MRRARYWASSATFLLLRPVVPQESAARATARPGLLVRLIPGLSGLRCRRPLRGQLALTLFLFGIVALGAHAAASWRAGQPRTGLATADAFMDYLTARRYPLPPVSFWPLFRTYRYAGWYWTAVGLALTTSTILQLKRNRRDLPAGGASLAAAPSEQTQTSLTVQSDH
jgi:hypothetical protein